MRIFKQPSIQFDLFDSVKVHNILQKLLWSMGVRDDAWTPIVFHRDQHLGRLLDDDRDMVEQWVEQNKIPTDEPILIERNYSGRPK